MKLVADLTQLMPWASAITVRSCERQVCTGTGGDPQRKLAKVRGHGGGGHRPRRRVFLLPQANGAEDHSTHRKGRDRDELSGNSPERMRLGLPG